ncbi:immunity 22 family protein [Proteus mirabilis]|nr:immunity 22 family protein [Proteus mirabilis]MCR1832362.1 immunity 22 family protein [Proteus mirabilis]MCU0101328.1 immunity 22 family protein [Proteus mirabilis]MCU0141038.1 immunity 22 family protein [Proteus mirabilis]MCW4520506.1 immunity 22 family protein [Proteus mirabilis]MDK7002450.1 immunity 22 family protein [Proteus mirabilis]
MEIIPRHKEDVSLDDILVDAAVDSSELNIIKGKCNNLGIKKANAIFWYQNKDFEIKKIIMDFYNGLKYIGLFQAD